MTVQKFRIPDDHIRKAHDYIESLYREDEREYAGAYLEYWLEDSDNDYTPRPAHYGVTDQTAETIRHKIRTLVGLGKMPEEIR